MSTLTRRQSFALFGGSLASAMLAPEGARAELAEFSRDLQALAPVTLQNPDNPGYEVFYRLSQLVTCQVDLDEAVARRCYLLFQQEPWGKEHIATTFQQIQDAIEETPTSVPELMRSGALGEGQTWFASHMLATWYFGIYYHESSEPVRVAFEQALMWHSLDGLVEAPGFSTLDPGAWSKPPRDAAMIEGYEHDG